MFNIAIFQDERRYLLQEIKVPVAWFVGGKNDMGYTPVSIHSHPPLWIDHLLTINDHTHSRRKTTRSSTPGSRNSVPASTQVTAVLILPLTAGNLVKRPLRTSSGSGGTTRLRRRLLWIHRALGVW
jgi:hypothetical protein